MRFDERQQMKRKISLLCLCICICLSACTGELQEDNPIYEGGSYSEEDEFRYMGHENTMEEYEELEDSTDRLTECTEELVKEAAVNEYFFPDIGQLPEYEFINTFDFDLSRTASLSVTEVMRIDDGILYFIHIVHDSGTAMDMGWDRFQLGYFYVTSDGIWLLRGEEVLSHIETKDDIISLGTIICAKEGTEDKLGNTKGWHEYLEIKGDSCIYHGWNDMVETGFYERFEWKIGEGLVWYLSGYGAASREIDIYIGERGER